MIRKAAGRIRRLAKGARPKLIFDQVEANTKHARGKIKDFVKILIFFLS